MAIACPKVSEFLRLAIRDAPSGGAFTGCGALYCMSCFAAQAPIAIRLALPPAAAVLMLTVRSCTSRQGSYSGIGRSRGRIGPGRAAYNGVLVIVVAMAISTVLEGYRWSALAVGGALLATAGMVVALRARQVAAAPIPAPPSE